MRKVMFVGIISLYCMGFGLAASSTESAAESIGGREKKISAEYDIEAQLEIVLRDKANSEKTDLEQVKAEVLREEAQLEDPDSKNRYDFDRAFRMQYVEEYMIVEYFKQNKNFDKIIDADAVEWYVPYVASDGEIGVGVYVQNNGKYEWEYSIVEKREKILPEEETLISIVKQNIDATNTIQEIKYLCSFLYKMNMVYIKCDKEEYIIPYAYNLDMLNAEAGKVKLANGKLYTTEEFMGTMNTLFDEKKSMRQKIPEDMTGGGIVYRKDYTPVIVIAAVCSAIMIAILVVAAVRERRKHSEQ